MTEVPVRTASTIILLREDGGSFEVLLLRRNSRSSFMPDAYVYPGGVLEDSDAQVHGDQLAADVCGEGESQYRPFYVAALRECFEESNLLVATRGTLPSGSVRASWREMLLSNAVYMPEFLKTLGLSLDLGSLARFDRWITPAFESKRFDTHFFLAQVSEVSHAAQDDREVVEATWLRPDEALERHGRGELHLFPPTWVTLSWLTQFRTAEEAITEARTRDIAPIEPHFDTVDDQVIAYFPGHSNYPDAHAVGEGGSLWFVDGVWSYSRDRLTYRWDERDA